MSVVPGYVRAIVQLGLAEFYLLFEFEVVVVVVVESLSFSFTCCCLTLSLSLTEFQFSLAKKISMKIFVRKAD